MNYELQTLFFLLQDGMKIKKYCEIDSSPCYNIYLSTFEKNQYLNILNTYLVCHVFAS